MATASVPNTFVSSTAALAAEVNANFSTLVSFLNNNVVHADGSQPMTSNLDLNSNKIVSLATGTASGDAVNKGQLDAAITAERLLVSRFTRTTDVTFSGTGTSNVVPENEFDDDDGWWSSGSTFTVPNDGIYAMMVHIDVSAATASVGVRIQGTGFSPETLFQTVAASRSGAGDAVSGGVFWLFAGDQFKLEAYQSGSGSSTLNNIRLAIVKLKEF